MIVTWSLRDCYVIVIWLLYDSYMIVVWLLHDRYVIVIWLLYDCYMIVIWLLPWWKDRYAKDRIFFQFKAKTRAIVRRNGVRECIGICFGKKRLRNDFKKKGRARAVQYFTCLLKDLLSNHSNSILSSEKLNSCIAFSYFAFKKLERE